MRFSTEPPTTGALHAGGARQPGQGGCRRKRAALFWSQCLGVGIRCSSTCRRTLMLVAGEQTRRLQRRAAGRRQRRWRRQCARRRRQSWRPHRRAIQTRSLGAPAQVKRGADSLRMGSCKRGCKGSVLPHRVAYRGAPAGHQHVRCEQNLRFPKGKLGLRHAGHPSAHRRSCRRRLSAAAWLAANPLHQPLVIKTVHSNKNSAIWDRKCSTPAAASTSGRPPAATSAATCCCMAAGMAATTLLPFSSAWLLPPVASTGLHPRTCW